MSAPSLRDWLDQGGHHPGRAQECALREPWCWPADDARRAIASKVRPAPPPPAPGRVLLLSASAAGGSLWSTETESGGQNGRMPVVGDAAHVMRVARHLAARDLPILPRVDPLIRSALTVRLLYAPPSVTATTFDGPSCGLSLVLAEASRILDLPVPADLVASVRVRDDGTVDQVGWLAQKVRVVSDHALGVTRFLVPRSQLMEAGEVSRRGDLRLVPVDSLATAFAEVFGDVTEHLRRRWESDRSVALRCVDALHDLTLFNTVGLLGWSVVETTCELLAGSVPDDPSALRRLDLARRIAARHAGRQSGKVVLIPWPDEAVLRSTPRSARSWFVAHAVQSAADAGDAHVREWIARAEPYVTRARLERSADDLRMLGAIGRALGAIGAYDEAVEHLRPTVEDWIASDQADEASYPLAELLRVEALRGSGRVVDELAHEAVPAVLGHRRTETLSVAFTVFALGRARALVGDLDGARSALEADEVAWALTPDHLRDARARWRARILRAAGRTEEADLEAAALAGSGGKQHMLAQLDRANHTGADPTPWLEGLRAFVDARRLIERHAGAGVGAYVADHFRY